VEEIVFYLPLVIVSAYLLDIVVGDPEFLPHPAHPVRWMGRLIDFLERALTRFTRNGRLAGVLLAIIVLASVLAVSGGLMYLAYGLSTAVFLLVSIYLGWSVLSVKSLGKEASGVIESLKRDELNTARHRLSRIVGRPVLAVTYKAINTLDSMVGYKNSRYRELGWFSARLDDWANYLPARITAALMVVSSRLLGLDSKGAFHALKTDGRLHASPNAWLPQAAVAGALGIRLGGPASYFGEAREKPYIGQGTMEVEEPMVEATLGVMRLTSLFMLLLTLLFHMALMWTLFG
jgi:adenosylcobinamide-phosphate synthase